MSWTAQFQGMLSCVFARESGAVGDLPQAAMVPISVTASSRRAMNWRDILELRVMGRRMSTTPSSLPLTRDVTFCHAM